MTTKVLLILLLITGLTKCKSQVFENLTIQENENNNSKNALLIFNTNHTVYQLKINGNEEDIALKNIPKLYSNLEFNLKNIDFSINGNYIIFNTNDGLYASPLDPNKPNLLKVTSIQKVVSDQIADFTIDWVHNQIYLIRSDLNQIHVANVTAVHLQYVIVSTAKQNKLTSIAINPIESFIVWSQSGKSVTPSSLEPKSKIIKSNQNGANQITLFNEITPPAIVIDILMKRIYCFTDELFSTDYNGNDRKQYMNRRTEEYPIYFDIFGDNIFWSSNENNAIVKTNKFELQNVKLVCINNMINNNNTLNKIYGLSIVHSAKQPNGRNRCLNSNCSHLCIPLNSDEYECVCPYRINCITDNNKNENAKIIFSAYFSIYQLELDQYSENISIDNITKLYSDINNPMFMHYNLIDNYIIWNSFSPRNLVNFGQLGNKNDNPNSTKKINWTDVSWNTDFNIDWIHNLIYFIRSDLNKITVANVSSLDLQYVVINGSEANELHTITVNPIESFIVWAECGESYYEEYSNPFAEKRTCLRSSIKKSQQDGTNLITLVDTQLKSFPVRIVIDYELKRIYWIDRELFQLSSIGYNGNDRQDILKSKSLFNLIEYFDIFGDYIYWSNDYYNKIYKTNKFGFDGENKLVVVSALIPQQYPRNTKIIRCTSIIHSSNQPNGTNHCLNSNCDFKIHICIPIIKGYKCVCPPNIHNCTQSEWLTLESPQLDINENNNKGSLTTLLIIVASVFALIIILLIIYVAFNIKKRFVSINTILNFVNFCYFSYFIYKFKILTYFIFL